MKKTLHLSGFVHRNVQKQIDMDSKVRKNATRKGLFLIIMPILGTIMLLTLIQCDKGKRCENALCTCVYVTIPLKLQYPDGQPVLLDSSKVFWVSENRFLERSSVLWNEARGYGSTSVRKILKNEWY